MRNFYAFLLLVTSFPFYGQIVTIPDANFKNRLVNTNCASLQSGSNNNIDVDINNDGEIQESEAVQIQSLNLQSAHIASLDGVQFFTNLREINLNFNDLVALNFGNLNFLTSIQCSANQLTSIVLGPNVTYFYAPGNHLNNLDFIFDAPDLRSLDLSGNGLTNLDAITNVPNLRYLDVGYNSITSLNLNNTNLESVVCDNNLITSINASDLPPNLKILSCNYNQLTHLTLPNSITDLFCAYNQLTQLDLSALNLWRLSVAYNQLSSLEISPISNFTEGLLNISGNLYTSITLPAHPIGSFNCQNTNLTSLELLFPDNPFDAEEYFINNNLNLKYLNLKNGAPDFCAPDSPHWCYFTLTNNTALEFICVDESELEDPSLLESVANSNNPNIQFSSYCSFTPGGDYNTIRGNIKLDMDANGCNASDEPGVYIPIQFNRSTLDLGKGFTDINGDYATYTNYGNITLTPQFENPYFTVTPASYTSNFSFTAVNETETANFCITPNGIHPDLEVNLFATTPARPGFDATYKIIYKNKGTTTQSGNVTLDFQDDVTDYVTASTTPNTIANGLIAWNFSNLAPFESREITVRMNVNSPLETPAVNAGSILILHANISSSATDENLADNDNNLEQVVVGSWDPNDKQVSVLSYAYDAPDKNYLYYTIRFQNMGTYAAENVVVADILSDKLNDDTLQMVSASHPYQSRYNKFTKKIEFIFEGINLPASINDEEASHGYVTFKIKPVSTLQQAQTVENKADIYFDFNAPVPTNTTSTYFYSLLKTDGFGQDAFFTLHPNPSKNTINVNTAKAIKILSIKIYNPLGQIIKTLSLNTLSASTAIDVSSLNAGTYFMEINSDQGKTTKKFIKL
ncbi:T9SS type A sorting domain-containing protein [Flavobacterium sp.]|uniref:T9SS type A sorting domain-containing protein n=1 Tax=Flavobacterium sp. TaxID=239 RepID=UPI002625FA6D|nr:T9SS type A sorting domain-containing protein [Flavobacterium sp.]